MDEFGRGHREMPACRAHDLACADINSFDEICAVGVQYEGLEALRPSLLADGVGGADVGGFVVLPPYFWEGNMYAAGLVEALVLIRI